jgi:hypothetical protein
MDYPDHVQNSIDLAIDPASLFEALDDHTRLTEHMAGMSLMMGGGRMTLEVDEQGGRAVGSTMKLAGSAFGMRMALTERVTERVPPARKSWATIDRPDLLVVGDYCMGFDIAVHGGGSRLTMWIDYAPSRTHPWLSQLLGGFYARWCVNEMLRSARALAQGAAS